MDRTFTKVNQGRVDMEFVADDISAHYFLTGDLFRVENEILKMIAQFDGACTESQSAHTIALNCDYDCMHCNKSIYALVKKKERFFKKRCKDLCARNPKVGDEWEVSLVSKEDIQPKYRNYFFHCNEMIEDKNIIELLFEAMSDIYSGGYTQTALCFVKIRRFDMPKALDVSPIANRYIQGFIRGESFDKITVNVE